MITNYSSHQANQLIFYIEREELLKKYEKSSKNKILDQEYRPSRLRA